MTTPKPLLPSDIFNEFEDGQFDKSIKRLPPDLNEATILKSSPEDVQVLMVATKSIIAFGGVNTGKKVASLMKKYFQSLPHKDLLGIHQKNFIILLGLMHDLHDDDIDLYVKSFGEDFLKSLLKANHHFKLLWTLALLKKNQSEHVKVLSLFEELKTLPHASFVSDYVHVCFLGVMLEKKLLSPGKILEDCQGIEERHHGKKFFSLVKLRTLAHLQMGQETGAREHALSIMGQPLHHAELNYQKRILLESLELVDSDVGFKALLVMFPKLRERIISRKLTENEDEDLYVIRENAWKVTKYSSIEHDKKERVLDLVSGFYRHDDRKTFLSKNRALAMKAIISMGAIGIKDFLIGEYVFFDDNVGFDSIRKRSQDLVTQLQKIGIPLIRKNNMIFYDFKNSLLTVIIGADEYRGEIAYLKKKYEVINKKIITHELMAKSSTSSLYLKKWREESKITPTNAPYGDYRFN